MTELDDQIGQLRLELRRGIVVLAVLSQLEAPAYGYSLIQRLSERGLDVEEGTLYPLMRRLEKQRLLASEWEVGEARPRKYYRISDEGRALLATLRTDWFETVAIMDTLLKGVGDG
jgi:PadR family transcriptional regulator, regulatory protein PadR